MKKTLLSLSLLAAASAGAQTLDCAALRNSAEAMPANYIAECLGGNVASFTPAGPLPNAPTDLATTNVLFSQQAGITANNLFTHPLNNYTLTLRGATNPSIFGMDYNPAGTALFGVTGATAVPNPRALLAINPATGASTVIATITGLTTQAGTTESPTDIVINPSTGAAFLSTFESGSGESRLYTINLATGVATSVGSMGGATGAPLLVIDLAINCAGEMFGFEIVGATDRLVRINPANAALTNIGPAGIDANFAQGMDFDAQDGTLYAWALGSPGGVNTFFGFGRFNLVTGAFTSIATLAVEIEGAIPTQCSTAAAPSITLTKRVQLSTGAMNICTAAGTSVTLPFGGGVVDYCYTVFNTGTTPLITHNLTDPAFVDPILVNLQFVLNPTNGVFVRATKTVTRTESTGATWSACNQANNCTGAVVASASVAAGTIVAGVAEVAANAFGTWGLGLLLLGVGAVSLLAVRRYS